MQQIDAQGARLDAKLFIQYFREARKVAPPRFLTLRLHPDRYKELVSLADIPESIQLGPTPGPMGRTVMRVNCIKPPLGVSDGIAIAQDANMPSGKIIIEVHGVAEIVIQNLAI